MTADTLTKDQSLELMQAEIERLRGLLREMSEACYAFNDGNRDPWVRFNASLSRLREALGE